jgi:hypothetical protein
LWQRGSNAFGPAGGRVDFGREAGDTFERAMQVVRADAEGSGEIDQRRRRGRSLDLTAGGRNQGGPAVAEGRLVGPAAFAGAETGSPRAQDRIMELDIFPSGRSRSAGGTAKDSRRAD